MADTKKYYVSKEKLAFYDGKIKKFIGDADAAVLAEAQSFAEGLGVNYDAAGLAATKAGEVQTKLDAEVARAQGKENELAAAIE